LVFSFYLKKGETYKKKEREIQRTYILFQKQEKHIKKKRKKRERWCSSRVERERREREKKKKTKLIDVDDR